MLNILEMKRKIKMNIKKEILKEIEELVYKETTICNDPMNGCPVDFAKEYRKKINKTVRQALTLGITDEEIGEAIAKGYSKAEKEIGVFWG